MSTDSVDHPPHYNAHPSGVECIQVVEHMGFNLGNAVKYIWRADEKGNALEDLRKAAWYVNREIERRGAGLGLRVAGVEVVDDRCCIHDRSWHVGQSQLVCSATGCTCTGWRAQ